MAPNRRKQTNTGVALATRPINETLDLRFADNVRRQLIPNTFQSYDELLFYLNFLHREGKSKEKIEEAVGVKTGRDFSYSRSGGFSLNTRKMAELVPLGLIDHIKEQEASGIFPPGTTEKYLDDVHRTWNDSSKRTQKIAATTAGSWDNGHWVAAKDPENLGPTTGRNANPEPQKSFIGADGVPVQGNAVHQQMPRANINQAGLDSLGIPKNWFEDFYEFVMRDPKLNRSGTNMGSGLGRSLTDAEAMSINAGYESPDQLVDRVDKQTQLTAQGVSLEGVNPNDTMAGPVTQKKAPLFPEYSKGKAPKGLMPNRRALTALAAGGVATLGPLSTAASAAETTGRVQLAQQTKDPADFVQAGIAGVSTLADMGTYIPPIALPAEVVSTGADMLNVGFDAARSPEVQQAAVQTVQKGSKLIPKAHKTLNPVADKITNEAKYFIINPLQKAFKNVFGSREI